jgi:hypothetical protein
MIGQKEPEVKHHHQLAATGVLPTTTSVGG